MRSLLTLPAAPLVVAALLAGCATRVPPADAIVRLQAERDRQPEAAAVHRSLGIALYKAGRFADARSSLDAAARLAPQDGTTALYLGLAAEQQGDFAAAREAYSRYLRHGQTRKLRSQLEKRLAAVQRQELAAAAKAAVASEETIGNVPGDPRVVAVLPFHFAGADESLRPLERGFAELLTTDLARSSQLTVVERARLQAILDELALQSSGVVDTATRVRAGRLLRAGRLVQGSLLQLGGNQLRADAAVIDVPTTAAVGGASADDALDALLEVEKRLVLELFTNMGVTLTVAERNAIEQRPTRSLAAFLAYSRGLLAEDGGDFDAATRHFQDAFRIDPRFQAAQQRGAAAANLSAAQQMTPAALEAQTAGTVEGQVAEAATQGTVASGSAGTMSTTASSIVNGVNPTQSGIAAAGATTSGSGALTPPTPSRDPAAELTGNDNPSARAAKVIIVVPIPGTSPRGE